MEVQIECPNCDRTLAVPEAAIGQMVRCPACKKVVQVPQVATPMVRPDAPDSAPSDDDDEFSAWIEEDLEDLEETRAEKWKRELQEEKVRKEQERRKRRDETARRLQQVLDARKGGKGNKSGKDAATAEDAKATDAPAADKAQAPSDTQPESSDSPSPVAEQAADYNPYEDQDEQAQKKQTYPKELLVSTPRPYLAVRGVTQEGVRLAFDSSFITDPGFRRSMPVACVFSGSTEVEGLVAKPLAFLDQTQAEVRNAQALESGHEQHLSVPFDVNSLLQRMGTLEMVHAPFNTIVPYYVRSQSSALSLQCATHKEGDRITCEVLIPNGRYALRWLALVNGVCGVEYRLLVQDVRRTFGNAWERLGDEVRQRLGTWCEFEPGERFAYYINDSEFGQKDEGLAGVVLTDRRLIYHRYHRRGSVRFDDTESKLTIRPDGDDASLVVSTPDGKLKAARFHVAAVPRFQEAVKSTGLVIDVQGISIDIDPEA